MKGKRGRVLIIALAAVAICALAGYLIWRQATLPPKGQLEILHIRMADTGDDAMGGFGGGSNISVSGPRSGQALGDIVARLDSGREIVLPFFDAWFADRTYVSARQYGAISINRYVRGEVYDAELGKKGLIVITYDYEGERVKLPVGIGSRFPYRLENGAYALTYAGQPEAIEALWESLRGAGSTPVLTGE